MVIAFHYRLPADPIDPKAEKPGSWKVFPDKLQANAWIGRRKQKTKTSPQGGIVVTESDLVNRLYAVWQTDGPTSLVKAAAAYLRYKSLPA